MAKIIKFEGQACDWSLRKTSWLFSIAEPETYYINKDYILQIAPCTPGKGLHEGTLIRVSVPNGTGCESYFVNKDVNRVMEMINSED
ncbi:MAG: hypothetical protein V4543_06235 [Bacteroidota bacterium]